MRLARTAIIHFTSKVAASFIGFLAMVYFARELGASTLGTYFVVVAILSWARIPMNAINSAVKKRVSEGVSPAEFVTAGLAFEVGLYVIVASFFLAAKPAVNSFIGAPLTEFALVVFGAQVLFYWASACLKGQSMVGRAGFFEMLERAVRALLQVTLVVVGFRVGGLLGGMVLSFAFLAILMFTSLEDRPRLPRREHFVQLNTFARYSWLGNVKLKTFVWMDTLVLNVFVATALIGVYEISWNLAGFLILVSNSIGQTLFPEISRLATEDRYDRIKDLVNEALGFSGLFMIPGFVGAVVIGPEILSIYGREFQQGYTVLLLLIAARTLDSYASQFNNAINSIDRPDIAFRINLVYIVANLVLNIGLIYLYGWHGAAVATGISAFLVLVLDYVYIKRLIGGIALPVGMIGKQVLAAVSMGLVITLVKGTIPLRNDYVIAAVVLAGATVYTSVLLVIAPDVRTKLISLMPQ